MQGQHLRNLAAELNERLLHAAATLERLTAHGWSSRLAMYEVILSLPGVETREEAEKRLGAGDCTGRIVHHRGSGRN